MCRGYTTRNPPLSSHARLSLQRLDNAPGVLGVVRSLRLLVSANTREVVGAVQIVAFPAIRASGLARSLSAVFPRSESWRLRAGRPNPLDRLPGLPFADPLLTWRLRPKTPCPVARWWPIGFLWTSKVFTRVSSRPSRPPLARVRHSGVISRCRFSLSPVRGVASSPVRRCLWAGRLKIDPVGREKRKPRNSCRSPGPCSAA